MTGNIHYQLYAASCRQKKTPLLLNEQYPRRSSLHTGPNNFAYQFTLSTVTSATRETSNVISATASGHPLVQAELHCVFCHTDTLEHITGSHRAEAFGKSSWITALHHISLFYQIQISCSILSFCDNKAIVQSTRSRNLLNSMYASLCPDFDVLRSIAIKQQQLMAVTSKYSDTRHVKGHQDRTKGNNELTIEEQLNIRADELASQALETTMKIDKTPQTMVLPHAMAYLSIDDSVQSSKKNHVALEIIRVSTARVL